MTFLKGRANRVNYWLAVISFAVIGAVMNALMDDVPTIGFTCMLILLFILRLHDIGISGWWAPAPFLANTAMAFGLAAVNLPNVGLLVSGAVLIVCVVALGAVPGQLEANRYGEPPPGGLRAAFKMRRS